MPPEPDSTFDPPPRDRRTDVAPAPSIYAGLLRAALERSSPVDQETIEDALAHIRGCRSETSSRKDRAGWAADAVADQLVYDVALIRVARALGIECATERFDRPDVERMRLERVITARGVSLVEETRSR